MMDIGLPRRIGNGLRSRTERLSRLHTEHLVLGEGQSYLSPKQGNIFLSRPMSINNLALVQLMRV